MMEIQCDSQEPESCFAKLLNFLKDVLITSVMILIGLILVGALMVLLVKCCADKGPWIIVATSNTTIKGARYECDRARKNQLPSMIYLKNGYYVTTISLFATQQEAEKVMKKLLRVKKVRSDAYIVNLKDWCPVMTTGQNMVVKCQ